ncbi:MAG: putative 2-dehydropantoate 2-reductase [Prolixibacteraceae bacterium]
MAIRYGIIGTGALGGFYGGKLAKAGHKVHFLLRSDYDFVIENGLQVDSVLGDFHLPEINAYPSTDEMPVCDVVFVCLKTTENHILPDLLRPILHSKTMVVLLQNGLGLEEELSYQLPGVQIAGGLAFICSNKVGPGRVQHLDFGKLILGSYNLFDSEILLEMVGDFKEAGIPAELSSDLRFSRWQKLVWNIPFNGLTVVLNTTTDKIMADPVSRQLATDMMFEVIAAANSCGVQLKESLAQQMIDMTMRMKPYATSMKLDYDFHRPMEIEYIYSKPIETALAEGYVMEKVSVLEKQLKFIQAGNSF